MPFATVIFDCDSTLSTIEGIDELASNRRAEIAELTEAAMRGEVTLEEVYGRRLKIVLPTRQQVNALGEAYINTLVPDAREVCAALVRQGIDVRVVSGGLRPAVLAVARELGVRDDAVAAVDLTFDSAGNYSGFEIDSPLARSGGKLEVLRRWMPDMRRPILFVGDGATDLEARPVVDLFVCFAGVVARPTVIAAADIIVYANTLAPIYALAVMPASDEIADPELFEKGAALVSPFDLAHAAAAAGHPVPPLDAPATPLRG